MFMAKPVVMTSWVPTYVQTHRVYTLIMHSFLHVNHASIKWFKKEIDAEKIKCNKYPILLHLSHYFL